MSSIPCIVGNIRRGLPVIGQGVKVAKVVHNGSKWHQSCGNVAGTVTATEQQPCQLPRQMLARKMLNGALRSVRPVAPRARGHSVRSQSVLLSYGSLCVVTLFPSLFVSRPQRRLSSRASAAAAGLRSSRPGPEGFVSLVRHWFGLPDSIWEVRVSRCGVGYCS